MTMAQKGIKSNNNAEQDVSQYANDPLNFLGQITNSMILFLILIISKYALDACHKRH
jgi:hypothetical protein